MINIKFLQIFIFWLQFLFADVIYESLIHERFIFSKLTVTETFKASAECAVIAAKYRMFWKKIAQNHIEWPLKHFLLNTSNNWVIHSQFLVSYIHQLWSDMIDVRFKELTDNDFLSQFFYMKTGRRRTQDCLNKPGWHDKPGLLTK